MKILKQLTITLLFTIASLFSYSQITSIDGHNNSSCAMQVTPKTKPFRTPRGFICADFLVTRLGVEPTTY